MSTYKRISGDFNIDSINASDNVIVTTHTVQINGNLDVLGNVTYINSTELEITDPFIVLAANNSGAYSNVGVLAQYNNSPDTYASIRFNVTANRWEYSTDNTTFYSVGAFAPGGSNTTIQFNNDGVLEGDVDFTYDRSNLTVEVNGYVNLKDPEIATPTPASGLNIYANSVSGGGTGVYVKSSSVDEELVSKSKAIVYAIIF